MNEKKFDLADAYDQKLSVGKSTVTKAWPTLMPLTKVTLSEKDRFGNIFFNESGVAIDTGDESGGIANFLLSIGGLQSVQMASLPVTDDGVIPSEILSDDVLTQAAEILQAKVGRDPVFLALAIRAVIKQQTAKSLIKMLVKGGTLKKSENLGLIAFGRFAGLILFGLGLPVGIGFGFTLAFQGNGFGASLCVAFSLLAYLYLRSRVVEKIDKEAIDYEKWCSLQFSSHVGAGSGLLVELHELVKAGISVPMVLFDLCEMLYRQWNNEIENNAHK